MHFMTLCATWSLYHVALDHPQSRFWLPKMIWTWIFWFLFGVHSYLSTRSFSTSLPHHLNLSKWPTFIPKRRQLRIDIVLEYLQRHFIAQYCKYILLRSVGENMTWTNLCAKYTISAISLAIVLRPICSPINPSVTGTLTRTLLLFIHSWQTGQPWSKFRYLC